LAVPTRHTHERVDQLFSRFSVALNAKEARTIPEMLRVLKHAFDPKPQFYPLFKVLDFTEWITPHVFNKVSGHAESHQFVIERIGEPDGLPHVDEGVLSRVKCSLWSNSPHAKPVSVLMTLPTGQLSTKAGRPLFYRKEDAEKGGENAPKLMKKCQEQVEKIKDNYQWTPDLRSWWDAQFVILNEAAVQPKEPYVGWWPQDLDWVKDLFPDWVAPIDGASAFQCLFSIACCRRA
jgi:hypothetical protein